MDEREKTKIVAIFLIAAMLLCIPFRVQAYTYNLGNTSSGDTVLTLNSISNGGSDNFIAVLRNASANTGIILLHGRGENTFDGHVILPLRLALSSLGYTTLSIDTPVPKPPPTLPNPLAPTDYVNYQFDASEGANYVFPELYARVRTATDELKSLGIVQAVLIGFSLGAREGSAYMRYGAMGSIPIVGYVGVGMGSDELVPLLDSPTSLAGVTVPVLDLYGSQDNSSVLIGVTGRKDNYNGPSYTQIKQEGSSHQWVGYEPELITYVDQWMALIPESVTIEIKPGSNRNCFNQNEKGVIPVAIFGSADLDVTQIDIESLALQGLSVKIAGRSNKYLAHYDYVNGDDYLDLIVQFQDSDDWINSENGYATVWGKLNSGKLIQGMDTICFVP